MSVMNEEDAVLYVPEHGENRDLPEEVQDVVIECCYQLGVSGFSNFKKTLRYLEQHELEKAAVEMLDSKWAKQTPNRAKKLSDIVKYAK